MISDRNDDSSFDGLVRGVLQDDLPVDVEFRMRKRLASFRHALGSSKVDDREISAGLRERRAWVGRLQLRVGIRNRIFAYASAVMLAAGIIIHFGGYQNLLADSISLIKTSISLTGQLRRVDAMNCSITVNMAGARFTGMSIRWNRDGRTRVDISTPGGEAKTLWLVQGRVMVPTAPSVPAQAEPALLGLLEPFRSLFSPNDLARMLDEKCQLQPAGQSHGTHSLNYVDRQDRAGIEILFDRTSFLPLQLSRTSRDAGSADWIARFRWNRLEAPGQVVPRLEPGKKD